MLLSIYKDPVFGQREHGQEKHEKVDVLEEGERSRAIDIGSRLLAPVRLLDIPCTTVHRLKHIPRGVAAPADEWLFILNGGRSLSTDGRR